MDEQDPHLKVGREIHLQLRHLYIALGLLLGLQPEYPYVPLLR